MHALVDQRERTLAFKVEAAKRKLMAKAVLVGRFKQPWTKMPMHFDARRDHLRGSVLKSSRLLAFMCHLFSIDAGQQELRSSLFSCTRPGPCGPQTNTSLVTKRLWRRRQW